MKREDDPERVYACKVIAKANLQRSKTRMKLQSEIKIHKSFFPTLGQLAEIVEVTEKSMRPPAPKQLEEPEGDPEECRRKLREIISNLSGGMSTN